MHSVRRCNGFRLMNLGPPSIVVIMIGLPYYVYVRINCKIYLDDDVSARTPCRAPRCLSIILCLHPVSVSVFALWFTIAPCLYSLSVLADCRLVNSGRRILCAQLDSLLQAPGPTFGYLCLGVINTLMFFLIWSFVQSIMVDPGRVPEWVHVALSPACWQLMAIWCSTRG